MRKETNDHIKIALLLVFMVAAAFGIFKGTGSDILIGDAVAGMDYNGKSQEEVVLSVSGILALSVLAIAAVGAFVLVRNFESGQKARFEAQNYIRAAKERGFDDEQIHQRLVEHGWDPEDVLHHFRE